ncbi:hypothetical protein [Reticulibacter mediterranei]|uniref:hypothetical protein n=1 Tax=Reticulibacter mediterranei TaxID=2778369 RepID=UPI001C68E612|nr:hypothetical protein [Reticulibacter mediterranei]
MFTKVFRTMLPGVVLLGLFLLATSSAFAATSAPLRKAADTANAPCQTLEVHLNGTQPATTRCLDGQTTSATPSTSGVTPNITRLSDCPIPAELDVYWDANQKGHHICFIGSGVANMKDYQVCNKLGCSAAACAALGCVSWDNEASSYFTGCSPVEFYTNVNRTGYHVSEPAYHNGNFTPGPVDNDTLSSVYLSSGCTG